MQKSVIYALNQLLDLKDISTGVHSTRLAEWGVRVAQELGIEESCLHDIEVAALLHDIGKMGIPDNILLKAGPLSEEEWAIMRRHPIYALGLGRLPSSAYGHGWSPLRRRESGHPCLEPGHGSDTPGLWMPFW